MKHEDPKAEAPKIDSMLIAMAPEQIVLFKSIVESYDNIATLRTEDPTLHHLRIYFAADSREEVEALIDSLTAILFPDEAASTLAAALSRPAPSPVEQAHRIAGQRLLRNLVVLLAIAVVTIWAGLTALYFDKAFGSPRDYVTILLWGFTAQTVLTSLSTALDVVITKPKASAP